MTQRDRSSSSFGAPSDRCSASPVTLGSTARGASRHAPLWEQWYALASSLQRQEALGRSATQGLLYAHQLPAPEGGPPAAPLKELLEAAPAPFAAPRIDPIDSALDEEQREAVARALHTPDVALVLGYP